MEERLAEGTIDLKKPEYLKIEPDKEKDLYGTFEALMSEKLKKKNKSGKSSQGGLMFYLDIFKFKEVVDYLRLEYGIAPPVEEALMGNKFGLALSFDVNMGFKKDLTFYCYSEYIRRHKEVCNEETFQKFEEDLKTQLEQTFARDDDQTDEEYAQSFNKALESIMTKLGVKADSCRVRLVYNFESDDANLHSFYIEDLEKARELPDAPGNADYSDNLIAYLNGRTNRTDLDSKRSSSKFAPEVFESILSPENYPLGKFPSSTEFAPCFMQQVAINLAIGYDSSTIRSVNGPPGTGKTTLLKDIFAELVVKQAKSMAELTERNMKGTEATVFFGKSSIGLVPENIAENGIIVASSNNGAVRNIVDELPQIKALDSDLVKEIKNADYFWKLSNSKLEMKFPEDGGSPEFVCEETGQEDKYWGLFSQEGGRKANLDKILTALVGIEKYLSDINQYKSDYGIYNEFMDQYEQVRTYRQRAANFRSGSSLLTQVTALERALSEEITARESDLAKRQQNAAAALEKLRLEIQQEKQEIQSQLEKLASKRGSLEAERAQMNEVLENLKTNKPGFFAGKAAKQQHSQQVSEASQHQLDILKRSRELNEQEQTLKDRLEESAKALKALQDKLNAELQMCQKQIADLKARLEEASKKKSELEQRLSSFTGKPLDMTAEYDELQQSNHWFDKDYRVMQARLFITALRVRKQFLYENRENITYAHRIMSYKKNYKGRGHLIKAAWDWVNLCIPVISSTFASFGRMCREMDVNSLGHLFVDEAGQAVPQAAVGAIMRSKYVMVVGDPSQIKPVRTTDYRVTEMLSKRFDAEDKYLSDEVSVQTLVDAASSYGYYRNENKTPESWIGIPLWVHRRSDHPMFDIANEIAYDGNMVLGKDSRRSQFGKVGWFNIDKPASDKYVPAQGEFLMKKIAEMAKSDPEILDPNSKSSKVYVITPFANVARKLAKELDKIHFTRREDGKVVNIGTVHTFQGKEAPIVFFVLGADKQSASAARWAVDEPNMMNVAATRAKREFYIIGDRALYSRLNTETMDKTLAILRKYEAQHPELVDNDINICTSPEQEIPIPVPQKSPVPATQSRPAPAQENKTEKPAVRSWQGYNRPKTPAPPAAEFLTGTVESVRDGKNTKFARVKGDDDKLYTIAEDIYANTPGAENVIVENVRIRFTVRPGSAKSKNTYIENIKLLK